MLIVTSLLNAFFLFQQFNPEIIDGYSDKISAYPGDSVDVYLNATFYSKQYTLKLYNLSEKVVHNFETSVFPQSQPGQKAYEQGFGYKRTCKVAIPEISSGIYLWENKIPIIVKTRNAKITIVYPSNTANAYCPAGGKSLYGFNSRGNLGAQIVSFHRPIGLLSMPKHFFDGYKKKMFLTLDTSLIWTWRTTK